MALCTESYGEADWPGCDLASFCEDAVCDIPEPTPDSGPCEVEGYCEFDGETCTTIFDDPAGTACQLTTQLRCITGRWRDNLSPVTVFSNDPDCLLPSCEAAGICPLDAGDGGDSSVETSDAGDAAVLLDGSPSDGGDSG